MKVNSVVSSLCVIGLLGGHDLVASGFVPTELMTSTEANIKAAQMEAARISESNDEFSGPHLTSGRFDQCPYGTLILTRRIATTATSRIYEADLVEEDIESTAMTAADDPQQQDEVTWSPNHTHELEYEYPPPPLPTSIQDEKENSNPIVIVKYMSDCTARLSREPLDGAVREFSFLYALNESGITPKVFYLSPSSRLRHRSVAQRGLVNLQHGEEYLSRCIRPRPRFDSW